jgi:predicted DNA-binding transcriptional regulator YafY
MAGGELRLAIRGRNVVEFRYSGRPRVVHPHALFVASTGTHCLDAVQVGGRSTSGPLPGWRRFDLNRIEQVTVLPEHFEIDPEFDERARDYRRGIVVESVQPVLNQ